MKFLSLTLFLIVLTANKAFAKRCNPDINCTGSFATSTHFNVHPTDCSKSYKCINGKARIYSCPGEQYFSVDLQQCVPQDQVTCARCEDEIESNPGETFDCHPTMNCEKNQNTLQFYRHPTDCTKSYKCSNGKPVVYNCPNANHFSAELQKCVEPSEDTCPTICVNM